MWSSLNCLQHEMQSAMCLLFSHRRRVAPWTSPSVAVFIRHVPQQLYSSREASHSGANGCPLPGHEKEMAACFSRCCAPAAEWHRWYIWLISYPSNHITLQLYVPLAMQWPCTCLTLLLLYQCGVCVIPLPLLLLFSLVPATNSWACSCSGVFSPAAGTYSEGGLSAVWRNVWEDVLFRASDSGKEKSSVFLSSF